MKMTIAIRIATRIAQFEAQILILRSNHPVEHHGAAASGFLLFSNQDKTTPLSPHPSFFNETCIEQTCDETQIGSLISHGVTRIA